MISVYDSFKTNEYWLAELHWQSLKRPGGNYRVTRAKHKYVDGELQKNIGRGYQAIGLWTLHHEHGGIREQMIFI